MSWYWYYIFGEVMSNVMQYFLKVLFKALGIRGKFPRSLSRGVPLSITEERSISLLSPSFSDTIWRTTYNKEIKEEIRKKEEEKDC